MQMGEIAESHGLEWGAAGSGPGTCRICRTPTGWVNAMLS